MNIGIYVTSVAPRSPSQARLQDCLFAGLERLASSRHQFVVFSHDEPRDSTTFAWPHQRVASRGRWGEPLSCLGARGAAVLLWLWRLLSGATGGRTAERLKRWASVEPSHFKQLRDLDIRLLWNMNQHELKAPVPFIRTIWELNHRIHSMYPEYAYARHGFDGLDAGMTDSLARASYVITGTDEGKRQIINAFGVHEGKIRVIPFPAPTLEGRGAPPAAPERPYVFYPARFWPHKNHVVVLEALHLLRERHGLELHCVFSGADEGNLDYVLQYADRLGIRDLVDYRGLVPESELASLYGNAQALVYASAVGPDNLPPLEAMSLGCPVITADVPGAREQYGEAALYFASMSEAELAERIVQLLSDGDLRGRLVERGRARAATGTVDDYAAAVMAIFDEFATIARAWERCDSEFT